MFKILVIDDKQAMCDEIKESFEEAFDDQVITYTATNGDGGYDLFTKEGDIDLIIIDIKNKLTANSPEHEQSGRIISNNIKRSSTYQINKAPIKFISAFGENVNNYQEWGVTSADDVYDKERSQLDRLINDVDEMMNDPDHRLTQEIRNQFRSELQFLSEYTHLTPEFTKIIHQIFSNTGNKPTQLNEMKPIFQRLINELAKLKKFQPPRRCIDEYNEDIKVSKYIEYLEDKGLLLVGQQWAYKNLWGMCSEEGTHRNGETDPDRISYHLCRSFVYTLMDLVQLMKNQSEYK